MLNPFFGFSILLHTIVIVLFKLLSLVYVRSIRRDVEHRKTYLIANIFVMFVVTGIVLGTAFTIVYRSVANPHSTIVLVRNEIENLSLQQQEEDMMLTQTATDDLSVSTATQDQIESESTETSSNESEKQYDSVVDLLKSRNQDSSMAARTALAEALGIQNYSGTSADNTTLLLALVSSTTAKHL